MSGPLVPPELAEVLGLMNELGAFLPSATTSAGWEQRHRVEMDRQVILTSRLQMLVDELKNGERHPRIAEDLLTGYCQRSAEAIRAELAKPLGYEPKQAGVPA